MCVLGRFPVIEHMSSTQMGALKWEWNEEWSEPQLLAVQQACQMSARREAAVAEHSRRWPARGNGAAERACLAAHPPTLLPAAAD